MQQNACKHLKCIHSKLSFKSNIHKNILNSKDVIHETPFLSTNHQPLREESCFRKKACLNQKHALVELITFCVHGDIGKIFKKIYLFIITFII